MTKRKTDPKAPARPSMGRAILFRLPVETDQKLEAARKAMGLDRVSYTRMILTERLNADFRA